MASSVFETLELLPALETIVQAEAFAKDHDTHKVDLTTESYCSEEGETCIFPVVSQVKCDICHDAGLELEQLPTLGYEPFREACTALLLGEQSRAIAENRALGIQCLSGTGALRIGAEFLHRMLARQVVYYSDPTWEHHHRIFMDAGFTSAHTYRYWSADNKCLDFTGMLADLAAAPENAVIILQMCGHNPTGVDLTRQQWQELVVVLKQNKLFPFLDAAYQGLASGDPNEDAWPVRYFVEQRMEFFCAQSFSEIFGLYSETVGHLVIVQNSAETTEAICTQMTSLVRGMYAYPPALGCQIVAKILQTRELRVAWLAGLEKMAQRLKKIRLLLYQRLIALGTRGHWIHLVDQVGLFAYMGLTEEQRATLLEENHIYVPKSGRINVSGINRLNFDDVAMALSDVFSRPQCPCDPCPSVCNMNVQDFKKESSK